MSFQTSLRPDLLSIARDAFEASWLEAEKILGVPAIDPDGIRALLARRIMAAAARGESDPVRLRQIALGAISGA